MSKKNKKHGKNTTLDSMRKSPDAIIGHQGPRKLPQSQDGFPLRYALTGDHDEIRQMVARIRTEQKNTD